MELHNQSDAITICNCVFQMPIIVWSIFWKVSFNHWNRDFISGIVLFFFSWFCCWCWFAAAYAMKYKYYVQMQGFNDRHILLYVRELGGRLTMSSKKPSNGKREREKWNPRHSLSNQSYSRFSPTKTTISAHSGSMDILRYWLFILTSSPALLHRQFSNRQLTIT